MSITTALRSAGMTWLRRARRASKGTAVVLTYHRVVPPELDPLGLAITPERFEEHVAALAERYRLMTAGDLLRYLEEGRRIPDDTVVITLDDGYAECSSVVPDILRRHDAVATAFVCSGYLSGEREYWVDALERLLLETSKLPEGLRVVSGDLIELDIPLPHDVRVVDADQLENYRSWRASAGPIDRRTQLFLALLESLKLIPEPIRGMMVGQLAERAGIPQDGVRPQKRMMSASEVATLHRGGIVEVGGHTTHHAALLSGTIASREKAVVECRDVLTALCDGVSPVAFAYPYGTPDTFDEGSERIVAEAGFFGAFTTTLGDRIPWGSVSSGSPRYRLPRTHASDVPATEMIRLIDKRLGR